MKKQLTLTTAVAATLLAAPSCAPSDNGWDDEVLADSDTAICIASNGERVNDEYCDDDDTYRSGFSRYYFRRSEPIPYYGDSIRNPRYEHHGSYQPRPGVSYTAALAQTQIRRSAAVSRGGLGSSGRFFGGGRS